MPHSLPAFRCVCGGSARIPVLVAVLAMLLGGTPVGRAAPADCRPSTSSCTTSARRGDYAGWQLEVGGVTTRSPARTPTAGSPGSSAAGRAQRRVPRGRRERGRRTIDRSSSIRRGGEIWLRRATGRSTPPAPAATGNVTVHYGRPDGSTPAGACTCGATASAPARAHRVGQPAASRTARTPSARSGTCRWATPTKPVNFIVHSGDDEGPGADLTLDTDRQGEAWIRVRRRDGAPDPGRRRAHGGPALPPGRRRLRRLGPARLGRRGRPRPTGRRRCRRERTTRTARSSGCRWPTAPPAWPTSSTRATPRTCPTTSPSTSPTVGHEVWLLSGQPRYLLPACRRGAARHRPDQGKRAVWLDRATVAWNGPGHTDGRRVRAASTSPTGGIVHCGRRGGRRRRRSGSTRSRQRAHRGAAAKYPHLWAYTAFAVDPADRDQVAEALRGQVVVAERDHDGRLTLRHRRCRSPGVLDDVYAGRDRGALGPTFAGGRPTLAVWAPTARTVELELFDTPDRRPPTVVGDAPRRRHRRLVGHRRADLERASTTGSGSPPGSRPRRRSSPRRSPTRTRWPWRPTPPTARSSTWPTRRWPRPGWRGLRKPAAAGAGRRSRSCRVRDFSIADDVGAGRAARAPTWRSPTRRRRA